MTQERLSDKLSHSSDALASSWVSDNGNGTYSNCRFWSDYPDNDVIRVEDTYYMVSTSMHLFPGCPIVSSKDLIHWKYEGYALPYDQLTGLANSGHALDLKNGNIYDMGAWAGSLRYNKKLNKFYFLVNMQDGTPEEYAILSVADQASGPWKLYRLSQRLYDPGLFFEDDGSAYVVHGQGQLYLSRLKLSDPVTGEYQVDDTFVPMNEDGYYDKPFYNYTGCHYNEGSHVYKVDGVYYILSTPTWSGTDTKKEICIQTPDLIHGPYAVRDIHSSFMNFGENGIHQGGIVDVPLPDGTSQWWSIIFQDRHKLGRTPTLQPVSWETDENGLKWPMIGEPNKQGEQAVVTYTKPHISTPTSQEETDHIEYFDDFTSTSLDLCWQWNHIPDDTKWSLTERPGCLRLYTASVTEDLSQAQNTLRQRIIGPGSTAVIEIDISNMHDGDMAGLTVHQKEYTFIGVRCHKNPDEKVLVIRDNEKELLAMPLPQNTERIWLGAKAVHMEYRSEFYYSLDGTHFERFGGRYDMHYGWYVGMAFGIFHFATKQLGGFIDVDSFSLRTDGINGNRFAPGEKIEAEHFDAQKYEIKNSESENRNENLLTTWTSDYAYTDLLTKWGDAYDLAVSNLHDGDWLRYDQIDLGSGAEWFNSRISGTASGGTLEVRQGSLDGRLLTVLTVPNTGDRECFINVFSEMNHQITGCQKLFLIYHGPDNICRINWFMFGSGERPVSVPAPEVRAEFLTGSAVQIDWTDVDNALEYDIKIENAHSQKIISNVSSPFCETDLDSSESYTIGVRSKNLAGYSEWSTPVKLHP